MQMRCMRGQCRLLLLLSALGIFFSCQRASTYDPNKIFRFNRHDNVRSLDPAFAKDQTSAWLTRQLFSGLVQLDDALEAQPDIAHSWEISPDGKTYTFHLRDDVYFHKDPVFGRAGARRVLATDFVYSFDRLKDPKVASPGGWTLEKVQHYKALNDTTFQIELKKPFPPFLSLLSMQYCSVVPWEATEKYGGDFRSHPVGTGPFYLKLWKENIKMVLRRNPLYYERDEKGKPLPYLEAVNVSFLPDKYTEFLEFVQGKIDFISGIDVSYKDELLTPTGKLRPKYADRFVKLSQPYLNTEYLAFRLDGDSPIDKNLRKAINHGFDKKKMIRHLLNGIGAPASGGIIPKGLPAHDDQIGYAYDPAKAREYLREYTRDVKPLATITLSTTSNYLNLCEYIQGELTKIGLKVKIDLMPSSALLEARANGKLPFFRAGWIADYPDEENYLALFYSKNFSPNGPNLTHYKNPQFDRWYETAVSVTNPEKRKRIYRQMDRLMMQEAPIVPLFYDEVTLFVRKNVKGLRTNAINLLGLKKVYKE